MGRRGGGATAVCLGGEVCWGEADLACSVPGGPLRRSLLWDVLGGVLRHGRKKHDVFGPSDTVRRGCSIKFRRVAVFVADGFGCGAVAKGRDAGSGGDALAGGLQEPGGTPENTCLAAGQYDTQPPSIIINNSIYIIIINIIIIINNNRGWKPGRHGTGCSPAAAGGKPNKKGPVPVLASAQG